MNGNPDSRFLAHVKSLLKQLYQTQLYGNIGISAIFNRLEHVGLDFDSEVLTWNGGVGGHFDRFDLDEVAGETCIVSYSGDMRENKRGVSR